MRKACWGMLWMLAACGAPAGGAEKALGAKAGDKAAVSSEADKGAGDESGAGAAGAQAEAVGEKAGGVIIDHTVRTPDHTLVSLSSFRGSALLIVNTATGCGLVAQIEGLQRLYERFESRGLQVLAFPSNDFGGQEPGPSVEVAKQMAETHKVTYPVFEKHRIKGTSKQKSALYRALTEETAEGLRGEVTWNFTKFLVDPEGRVVARFDPNVDPLDPKVIEAIEAVLPK